MDWSHTKERGWGNNKGRRLTMEPSGKQEKKTKEELGKIGYRRSGERLE
jgi:hypothetical protein